MKKTLIAFILTVVFVTSPLLAQQGGCVTVAVGSQEKDRGKFDTTFSATQVIDIDFSILFTPGAANRFGNDHVVEFRILTPKGHLYQSITIPFSSDASRKGKKVSVQGYPRPLETQLLTEVTWGNANHLAASGRLPVGGTPIVTSSLYGVWTAQAYVDGEAVPCAKPSKFTITQ